MANGRQIAQLNIDSLSAWLSERRQCNDWGDYVSKCGTKLNRTEITKELGCSPSVPYQNPVFKQMLLDAEGALVESGVLKKEKDSIAPEDRAAASMSAGRVAKLNERIKALEARNLAQREEINELKNKLRTYEAMDEYLTETGKLLKL